MSSRSKTNYEARHETNRKKRHRHANKSRHQYSDDCDTQAGSSNNTKHGQYHRKTSQERNWSGRNQQKKPKNRQPEEETSADSLEIPGFYYDKEKKKYFKILPNHNSGASGSITREVIKKRATEYQRQQDLADFFKPRVCSYELGGHKPSCLRSSNCYHIVTGCSLGLRSPRMSNRMFQKYFIQRLTPRAKIDVVQQSQEDFAFDLDNLEDAKKMLVSPDATRLVGVWSLKQFIRERLQMIEIEPAKHLRGDESVCLRTKASDRVHAFDIQKVTSMSWAPRVEESEHTSRILFTTTSFLGDANNMARLINLEAGGESLENNYFDIGPKSTWSCAWSIRKSQFGVGTEDCALLMDVATRRLWELYTANCSVYAMTISKLTGDAVYSGTRKGTVYVHDLRSRSTHPVYTVNHRHSVAHIHLAADESSMVVSDIAGKINKWDQRMRRVLHSYPGHVNQYIRQPFHVDQAQKLLFAVGQDCYTRVWCYQTGALLHCIPPPSPVGISSIPLIAYSDNMGGPSGLPGLLMASKAEFHFYSY